MQLLGDNLKCPGKGGRIEEVLAPQKFLCLFSVYKLENKKVREVFVCRGK